MIRHMTRREFSYESHDFSYRLPFSHTDVEDEKLVEQWAEWVKRYPGGSATCRDIRPEEEGYLRLSFLYEGDGEYHPFDLVTSFVYLTDLDLVVVRGWIEHAVHDLMWVVLRMDFFPAWTRALDLVAI
jgi:hypothetical protein